MRHGVCHMLHVLLNVTVDEQSEEVFIVSPSERRLKKYSGYMHLMFIAWYFFFFNLLTCTREGDMSRNQKLNDFVLVKL